MTDYAQSQNLYDRAQAIAGRSLTRSKAPGRLFDVGRGPLYASHGSGCRLIDVDGNEFIDMVCALGAISLGYGSFSKGVPAELDDGWIYSLPSTLEVQAAEMLLATVAPWASSVRFVKTGSEATHAALFVAQRATGRKAYLRLRGSYHGWHACWQEDADHVRWFDVGEYPPLGAFEQLAAVFIEPPRWQSYAESWIEGICAQARKVGALVVFDEMIYGGRVRLGGATELWGIQPDLACFGKAIGNGAPIACVVGRDALAEYGELISGTFSGDAVSLEALISTLTAYRDVPVIETLWKRGEQLRNGLQQVAYDAPFGYCFTVDGLAPVHQRITFANDASGALGRTFAAQMAKRGVLWHPQVANVMLAHSEDNIETVIAAAAESIDELRG